MRDCNKANPLQLPLVKGEEFHPPLIKGDKRGFYGN
jgi:hypothetical protein